MSFSITHPSGAMEHDPPYSSLLALVEELAVTDEEHPDVAVTHESGWTLSAMKNGRVIWENIEEDAQPRHLTDVRPEQLLRMMQQLANGDITVVENNPWEPGY